MGESSAFGSNAKRDDPAEAPVTVRQRALPHRVIIFGGSGFIGSYFKRHLIERGCQVTIADIVPPKAGVGGSAEYLFCDVRRPISFAGKGVGLVVNLAATHRTPGHAPDEYYETNIRGALNVARWVSEWSIPEVVFTSSIAVYGATTSQVDETSEPRPNSAYGHSKLLAEEVHRHWAAGGAARLHILRPGVVFGVGEEGNFARLARAMRSTRLPLPNGGATVKACIYAGDLLRATDFLLSGRGTGYDTFNVCYPNRYSLRQVCEAINDVEGSRPPLYLTKHQTAVAARIAMTPPVARSMAGQRFMKLLRATDVAPHRLDRAGFDWNTALAGALKAWQAESPSGLLE